MKLYAVRHGQTEYNLGHIYNEIPYPKKGKLTLKGKKQGRIIRKKLKNITISTIYTSAFYRTQQTARIVKNMAAPIIEEPLINEQKTGCDGMAYQEMFKILPKDNTGKLEKGESYEEFKNRLIQFINTLKKSSQDNVLIVTHGGVIAALHGILLNIPDEDSRFMKISQENIYTFTI